MKYVAMAYDLRLNGTGSASFGPLRYSRERALDDVEAMLTGINTRAPLGIDRREGFIAFSGSEFEIKVVMLQEAGPPLSD